MKWTPLTCPEGSLSVDLDAIDAVGPVITEVISGRTVAMRALYLRGGQCLVVLDTPENQQALFQVPKGLPS